MELKDRFSEVANEYLKEFCEKHDYDLENAAWVGQSCEEVAVCGDDYYNLYDIRYDIDNDVPVGEIEDWTEYCLRLLELECPNTINFPSWAKGAPKPYSEVMLNEIERAKKRVEEAKHELEILLRDECSS